MVAWWRESSICQLTPQFLITAKLGPRQTQDPSTQSSSPAWVAGTQTLATCFHSWCSLTESWIGQRIARTWHRHFCMGLRYPSNQPKSFQKSIPEMIILASTSSQQSRNWIPCWNRQEEMTHVQPCSQCSYSPIAGLPPSTPQKHFAQKVSTWGHKMW